MDQESQWDELKVTVLSGCTVPDPQFVRQHRQKESVLIHSEWQAPFPSTAGMVKDKSLS